MVSDSAVSSRSINSACAELIFCLAVVASNHAQRSISGEVTHSPEPRGHSVFVLLLVISLGLLAFGVADLLV